MNNEFILILGIVIGVLTVPAMFSAWMEGVAPRVATFSAVVSGALILYAIYNTPGGYTVNELPDIFARVVADIIR